MRDARGLASREPARNAPAPRRSRARVTHRPPGARSPGRAAPRRPARGERCRDAASDAPRSDSRGRGRGATAGGGRVPEGVDGGAVRVGKLASANGGPARAARPDARRPPGVRGRAHGLGRARFPTFRRGSSTSGSIGKAKPSGRHSTGPAAPSSTPICAAPFPSGTSRRLSARGPGRSRCRQRGVS